MPSKKTVKKPVVKKAAGKKVAVKKAKPVAAGSSKETVSGKSLLETRTKEKGLSIEDMISKRDIEQKSVEDFIGSPQQKQDMSKRPIIPGVFDLLIPPGTPRMLIIKLAKEHNLQLVRRDDIYVPIGVCDVERDLLAIRGDEKTIKKLEKILFREIDEFIKSKDARRHDYSKTPRLEGIGNVSTKKVKARAK